jgi:hypothetical protein
MIVHGLRIKDIGLEYLEREHRDEAITAFCKGSCIDIHNYGIKCQEALGAFSTYERDTDCIITKCSYCREEFPIEICPKRLRPKTDWDGKLVKGTEIDYICDRCLATLEKLKRAKKTGMPEEGLHE